jgi:hypothetical protein
MSFYSETQEEKRTKIKNIFESVEYFSRPIKAIRFKALPEEQLFVQRRQLHVEAILLCNNDEPIADELRPLSQIHQK